MASKNKPTLEMARLAYLDGSTAPNDIARQHGLSVTAFRQYLVRQNCIKPEHTNKNKRKVNNALQAIAEVERAEVILPKATQALLSDFTSKAETFKGKGLDFGIEALNLLQKALKNIDSRDLEQVVFIKDLANAAKLLSDMLGVYPKAPTIAIQNNQNVLNQVQGKGEGKKRDLNVIVEVVNDNK